MFKKFFLSFLFLLTALCQAQNNPTTHYPCGSSAPPIEWENAFQQLLIQYKADKALGKVTATTYTIPVVVHIIHGGEAIGVSPNLNNTLIHSQIQVLNDDFEGNGLNVHHIPQEFKSALAEIKIKFLLATIDTNGNTMSNPGIDRIDYHTIPNATNPATSGSASLSAFMKFIDDSIKPYTIWNPKKYLNIWTSEVPASIGLLGFATFPVGVSLAGLTATGTDSTDGVWCNSANFGLNNAMFGYNNGRTATHEVGHWLGLRHIWGDANCGDDYCSDTPPAQTKNFGLLTHPYNIGVCAGNTTGEMFQNFMDYTDDICKFIFTHDQDARTQVSMANGTHRQQLGTHNLVATVTVPVADFNIDDSLLLNKPIHFANTSLGTPATYSWNFGEGANPPSSNLASPPPVTYFTSGTKSISLTVSNSFGSNTTTRVKKVSTCSPNVLCADFESGSGNLYYAVTEVNQALEFHDISTGNPTSWLWEFAGGNPSSSSSANPTVSYTAPGAYDVQLIVSSGSVKDTILRKNYVTVTASYNGGTAFTSIALDTNKNLWAGTDKLGLYFLDKKNNPGSSAFSLIGSIPNNLRIYTIACDSLGNAWIGHGGTSTSSTGGGMERVEYNNIGVSQHYAPDRNAQGYTFLQRDGLATLNVQSVVTDKNNTVWCAQRYHDLTVSPNYYLTPGSLSYKTAGNSLFTSKSTWEHYTNQAESPELPYPAYTYNPPANQTAQTRTCNAIACNGQEVWMSVYGYTAKNGTQFPARLLCYNLNGGYTGTSYSFASIGAPTGGVFNGIYLTPKGDAWVSFSAGKGFGVRQNGSWSYVNPALIPCIYPVGALINQNAIWGNKFGNVFIGTNKGLIVYNGKGNVQSANSYTFYPLNKYGSATVNVTAGVAESDSIQWIATGNGIIRTVIGRYDMTQGNIDYSSCHNADMDTIETLLKSVTNNSSYHTYEVTTEICDINGPNGANCNAEFVYSMMKKTVSLTSPIPSDFPVNLIEIFRGQNNNILFSLLTNSPFENAFNALTNEALLSQQNTDNPAGVISCTQQYKLYSNAKSIVSRYLYDKGPSLRYFKDCNWQYNPLNSFDFQNSMDDYCGDKLESTMYDPIWIFSDDQDKIITNYTAKGHILYPGKVERTIVEECGKVKVITKGTGLQYCGNNCRGSLMAKVNTILGKHLFTEVDKRLKSAFEANHN